MLRADPYRRSGGGRARRQTRTSGRLLAAGWRDSACLLGGLVALLLLALSFWALRLQQVDQRAGQRRSLNQAVSTAASLLQADLAQALATADMLALLVRNTGQVEGFDRLAQDLMQRNPLVVAIALAPGGVIRQVAPLEGQAALIGRRMHDDPVARAELQEAVRKRAMVVSMPQALMGGGVGTVARLPVFRGGDNDDATPALWGYVLLQVKVPDVAAHLSSAGLPGAEGRFLLSALDSSSGHRIGFYPFPAPNLGAGESATLQMPQRQWSLAVEASPTPRGLPLLPAAIAVLLSGGAGLLCALALRRLRVRQAQRSFYRHSMPPLGWGDEMEETHQALARLRRLPGWASVLMVHLPDGNQLVQRVLPDSLLRGLLREPDVLVPVGGAAWLVVSPCLPDRAVAERLGQRLGRQLRDLALDGPVQVQQRQCLQPEADLRAVFAELVAGVHVDHAAQRRQGLPSRGGVVVAAPFAQARPGG